MSGVRWGVALSGHAVSAKAAAPQPSQARPKNSNNPTAVRNTSTAPRTTALSTTIAPAARLPMGTLRQAVTPAASYTGPIAVLMISKGWNTG